MIDPNLLDDDTEDENEDAEEDDRGSGWWESHFSIIKDVEDEIDEGEEEFGDEHDREEFERFSAKPSYLSHCWKCKMPVDDESLYRCSFGCGWIKCSCGSCLCDMPEEQRIERHHRIKIKHIILAKCICPSCRGTCFVSSRQSIEPTQSMHKINRCSVCDGRGFFSK